MNKTSSRIVRDLLIGILLLGFLLCYGSVFLFLVRQWRFNEIYSHGFLIPVISGYLLYLQRDSIRSVALKPSYVAGIPVLTLALTCLLIGRFTGTVVVEELSIVLSIGGILLLLFGRSLLLVIWFPVSYLLFMVPIWDIFTENAQHPLQVFSATIGVALLNGIGIPIHHNGILIEMPNITLEVAQACSGVNYLISVMAIGIPLSYLFLKSLLKRFLICFFAAFVALLSNGLRVFFVALGAYYGAIGANSDIHGPLHLFQALFVSVVGYIVIFLGVWVLRDQSPNLKKGEGERGPAARHLLDNSRIAPLACATVLVGLFTALTHYYTPLPVPPIQRLTNFPYEIGAWKGRDVEPGINLFRENGADHELSRIYTSIDTWPVTLSIEYFEYQEQGKEMIDYKTDYLFRGTDTVLMSVGPGRTVRLNRHVVPGRFGEKVYLYWVQIGGRVLLDRYQEKFHTLWNAVANRKTNGAIVMVSVEAPNGSGIDEAQLAGKDFLRQVHALLPGYIP